MPWGEENPLFCLLNQDYVLKNNYVAPKQHVEPVKPKPVKINIGPNAFPQLVFRQALTEDRFAEYESFWKHGGYFNPDQSKRFFDFRPWEEHAIYRKAAEAAEEAAEEAAKEADIENGFYPSDDDNTDDTEFWPVSTPTWYEPVVPPPVPPFFVPFPRVVPASSPTDSLMDPGVEPMQYLLPVPHPTALYHNRANCAKSEIYKLKSPKQLLVVLDLNGTLLVRTNNRASFIARQGLDQFLEYLFTNHTVAIWSSARPHNVTNMVNALFADKPLWKSRIAAIWNRDDLRLGPHYNTRVQIYKQLSWLWEDPIVQSTFPENDPGTCWDQSNTVLIDDSKFKALSEPHNLIQIDEFTIERARSGQPDDTLLAVANYLEGVKKSSDASVIMKNLPFVYVPMELGTWSCSWEDVGVKGKGKEKAVAEVDLTV